MRIGAHVSIAGGMDLAVARGVELQCDAMQVFVKNNSQWKAFLLADDVVKRYKRSLRQTTIHPVVAHASYLINLATSDEMLWRKSIGSFEEELERSDRLGIPYLVVHPGSHMGAGETIGIARVAAALNDIYTRHNFNTTTCIEHTAGQGNHIGYKFEHLAAIRAQMKKKNRFGVCLDTCHLFAAGYDYRTPEKYEALIQQIDATIGLSNVKCIHLNDSKTRLGSHVDRHETIGKGKIGRAGFRLFLRDPRFKEIPGLIETPTDGTGKWERRNLRVLRKWAAAG